MPDNIFSKIISGEISCHKIYEDDDFLAFLDIRPIHSGHTLLIPKEHIDYIFDVEDPLYSKLFAKAKELAIAIKAATRSKKVGLLIEGFGVPHVHLHLIPINELNDIDPNKATDATEEDLIAMRESICNKLQKAKGK